jgi:hypothetical protein
VAVNNHRRWSVSENNERITEAWDWHEGDGDVYYMARTSRGKWCEIKHAQSVIDHIKQQVDALTAERDRLAGLVGKMEWAGTYVGNEHEYSCCLWCKGIRLNFIGAIEPSMHIGHAPDCPAFGKGSKGVQSLSDEDLAQWPEDDGDTRGLWDDDEA